MPDAGDIKKPDWLPNWRRKDEYPNPKTTTAQQWAWEFLRRNEKYQADYEEIAAIQQSGDPEINRRANETINEFYGPIQFVETSPLPVSVMVCRLLPIMHEKKENFPWMPEVCWRLVANYNLQCPLDPARNCAADGLSYAFIERDILPVIETKDLIINPHPIPKKLTISIDLNESLTDQLCYIEGFLRAHAEVHTMKTNKVRKSDFLDYVRILDGLTVKARGSTIANKLGKKRSAYDKAVKNAKEFRDSGYLELSRSKRIPGKGARKKQGEAEGATFFRLNQTNVGSLPSGVNVLSSEGVCIHIKRTPKKSE